MECAPSDFPVRAERRSLPAAASILYGDPLYPRPVPMLAATARAGAWRLMDIQSTVGPFGVRLSWSSGTGGLSTIELIAGRGTRVALYATTMIVEAWSMITSAAQDVSLVIADAPGQTVNHYCAFFDATDPVPGDVIVPGYGSHARAECNDRFAWAGNLMRVLDGAGATVAAYTLDQQPQNWAGLGAARLAQIQSSPNGRVLVRLEA